MLNNVCIFLALITSALAANILETIASNVAAVQDDVENGIAAAVNPVEQALLTGVSNQCSLVKEWLGLTYKQIDDNDKEPDVNGLTIQYWNPSITVIFNITTAAEQIVNCEHYEKRQKLVIFVHGFTDSPSSDNFKAISSAFMADGETNVLALDSSSLIGSDYLRASTYVQFIGEKLGDVLYAMVKDGVNASSIYIIGHSLGAHISGFAGKTFANLTGGTKCGRITGLDPAGPCFTGLKDEQKLQKTDADFVDVIHTNIGVFGLAEQIGHLDFYVNGGSQQPECKLDTGCSHGRSVDYFAESVTNTTAFQALRCDSWSDFKQDDCNYTDISYMGYGAKMSDTHGRYDLQTNGESPFGRGTGGLVYEA